ncbi:MAG: hypothetical protein J6Y51_06760, partial [Bacteroidaceae bacterium]|nr:hypothetical protein [Bacteroidaceae bacterium]
GYFLLEGLAYRITPFNWSKLSEGPIDTDRMYANLMEFKFGGLDNPNLYLDETVRRMCYSHRRLYTQLATQLYNQGKKQEALDILNKVDAGISNKLLPYDDDICVGTAYIYLLLGKPQKAVDILTDMAQIFLGQACWYLSMDNHSLRQSKSSCAYAFSVVDDVFSILKECLEDEQFKPLAAQLAGLKNEFQSRIK